MAIFSGDSYRRGPLLLLLILALVTIVFDPGGLISVQSTTSSIFLILLLSLLIAAPIIFRVYEGKLDIADPLIWFVAFYFAHFVFRASFNIIYPQRNRMLRPSVPDEMYMPLMNSALILSIFALYCFYYGYTSSFGSRITVAIPTLPERWDDSSAFIVALGCLVIGWWFRLSYIYAITGDLTEWLTIAKRGEVLMTGGYAQIISNLAFVGLLILIILYRQRGYRRVGTLSIFLSLFEGAYAVFSGQRSNVLFMMVGIIFALYLTSDRTQRMNRLISISTILGIMAFILTFPLLSIIRFEGAGQKGLHGFDVTIHELVYSIAPRLHGVDSVALILYHVPHSFSHTFGKELLVIFVAWIPRSLWPNKPIINFGTVFQQKIADPGAAQYGIAPTLPGSFYWTFGILGVIIGMVLIGVLWRFVFEYLVKEENNESAILVVAVMAPMFFSQVEKSIVHLLTFEVFKVTLVLFVVFMMRERGS